MNIKTYLNKFDIYYDDYQNNFANLVGFKIPTILKKIKPDIKNEEAFYQIAASIFNVADNLINNKASILMEGNNYDEWIILVGDFRAKNFKKAIYEELKQRILSNVLPEFWQMQFISSSNLAINGNGRDFQILDQFMSPLAASYLINSNWEYLEFDADKLKIKLSEYYVSQKQFQQQLNELKTQSNNNTDLNNDFNSKILLLENKLNEKTNDIMSGFQNAIEEMDVFKEKLDIIEKNNIVDFITEFENYKKEIDNVLKEQYNLWFKEIIKEFNNVKIYVNNSLIENQNNLKTQYKKAWDDFNNLNLNVFNGQKGTYNINSKKIKALILQNFFNNKIDDWKNFLLYFFQFEKDLLNLFIEKLVDLFLENGFQFNNHNTIVIQLNSSSLNSTNFIKNTNFYFEFKNPIYDKKNFIEVLNKIIMEEARNIYMEI